MIDRCLVLILYIHGNSYISKPVFKYGAMHWNNSLSSLQCDSSLESNCVCTYTTIVHAAYDIQKEIQTVPFDSPFCHWLTLPKSYLNHNEIPVFLKTPLRGWSWNDDSRERAWLHVDVCS